MDPITGIGLGAQGVGLLGKALGIGGAENERQARIRSLREFLQRKKAEAIQRASVRNAGMMANSRQAALTRAAAAGRTGEAESYILPAEQRAAQVASENVDRTVAPYNQAEINAETDFANRPIEPGFLDYLGEAGSVAADYGIQNENINAWKQGMMGSAVAAQGGPGAEGSSWGDLGIPPTQMPSAPSESGRGLPMGNARDVLDMTMPNYAPRPVPVTRARKATLRAMYPRVSRSGAPIF